MKIIQILILILAIPFLAIGNSFMRPGLNYSLNRIEESGEFDEDVDNEDEFQSAIWYYFVYVASLPYWLPIISLEENYPEKYYFQSHPFSETEGIFQRSGRKMMYRVDQTFQIDDEYEIYSSRGQLNYKRWGIDLEYKFWEIGNKTYDGESIRYMISHDFARSYKFRFSSGLGYNHFFARDRHDGISYKYSGEFFHQKLRFCGEYLCTIYNLKKGEKVKYNNSGTITLGWFWECLEFRGGYNWQKLEYKNISAFVFGLSCWF